VVFSWFRADVGSAWAIAAAGAFTVSTAVAEGSVDPNLLQIMPAPMLVPMLVVDLNGHQIYLNDWK
jgi:hypothetical protein